MLNLRRKPAVSQKELGALYCRYGPAVHRRCSRILGERARLSGYGEELTQTLRAGGFLRAAVRVALFRSFAWRLAGAGGVFVHRSDHAHREAVPALELTSGPGLPREASRPESMRTVLRKRTTLPGRTPDRGRQYRHRHWCRRQSRQHRQSRRYHRCHHRRYCRIVGTRYPWHLKSQTSTPWRWQVASRLWVPSPQGTEQLSPAPACHVGLAQLWGGQLCLAAGRVAMSQNLSQRTPIIEGTDDILSLGACRSENAIEVRAAMRCSNVLTIELKPILGTATLAGLENLATVSDSVRVLDNPPRRIIDVGAGHDPVASAQEGRDAADGCCVEGCVEVPAFEVGLVGDREVTVAVTVAKLATNRGTAPPVAGPHQKTNPNPSNFERNTTGELESTDVTKVCDSVSMGCLHVCGCRRLCVRSHRR